MNYRDFKRVIQRTKALLNGEGGRVGFLRNGQDPQAMDDCDLLAFIQQAGIEDIAEDFQHEEIELTHGSLAAAAFAISELEETKPQVQVPSTSHAPVAGSFIGQNQLQPAMPPLASQGGMDPVVMQQIAQQVAAIIGQQGQTASSPVPLESRKMDEKMDIAAEAANPDEPSIEPVGSTCQVTGSEELPVGVRLSDDVIKKIFDGCQAKLESTLKAATIVDKQDNTTIEIGSIDYTLRYHKIESFSISNALLNIEYLKNSESYKVTIPNINFKVAAEFKYKTKLVLFNGPKGTGSYNVVGRNWSTTMIFKFEAAADRTLSFQITNCYCTTEETDLVNLECSVESVMSTFKKTPRNYVREQIEFKLVEAFKSLATHSAQPVLRKITWKGTREELQLAKFYPGMSEGCILKVCNVTLRRADLTEDFMAINPNVIHHLPDDVVSMFTREQARKTDQHNPSVQAKGIFKDALRESRDPTKMRRLLAILEEFQPRIGKTIEGKHSLDITDHKRNCSECH